MFELVMIGAIVFIAWQLHRLELKVEALEHVYNQLANIIDEMRDEKQ